VNVQFVRVEISQHTSKKKIKKKGDAASATNIVPLLETKKKQIF
jgi:hypothetical protein